MIEERIAAWLEERAGLGRPENVHYARALSGKYKVGELRFCNESDFVRSGLRIGHARRAARAAAQHRDESVVVVGLGSESVEVSLAEVREAVESLVRGESRSVAGDLKFEMAAAPPPAAAASGGNEEEEEEDNNNNNNNNDLSSSSSSSSSSDEGAAKKTSKALEHWTGRDVKKWLRGFDALKPYAGSGADGKTLQSIRCRRDCESALGIRVAVHQRMLLREVNKVRRGHGRLLPPICDESRGLKRRPADETAVPSPNHRLPFSRNPLRTKRRLVHSSDEGLEALGRQVDLGLDLAAVEKEIGEDSYEFTESGNLLDCRSGLEITSTNFQTDDLVVFGELGRGACASVRRALHVPTMTLVALKVVAVHDDSRRRQLLRELSALHQFSTVPAHIVAFHGAFTNPTAGCVCAVLEYMDSKSVHDVMDAREWKPLDDDALSVVAHGCAAALAALHADRQLHRDVKPSNILLDWRWRVKLGDFGVSRAVDNTLGIAQTYIGTLAFMAPERIIGGDYSFPSDVWSVGLCLATVALGRVPLPQNDGYWAVVRAICDADPPRLDPLHHEISLSHLTNACLSRRPHDRPDAPALLQHAFVQRGHALASEMANALGTPDFRYPVWHTPDAAPLNHLHDIAKSAIAWVRDRQIPPTYFDRLDLAPLADQLRLPVDTVRHALNTTPLSTTAPCVSNNNSPASQAPPPPPTHNPQ
ncbi:hypothetical protein CTAYLR_003760 [Chrysophaeum taylorii]|uniref:mitogen-activated protein kinase kinase n=1 Tax=Chrysophaeum taylorii TaxID=2483200 RepID=A0AAD7UDV6_9STRA|nr:hypothetical protein CTAYLR_003760 [Chrysophaeum taylorii]